MPVPPQNRPEDPPANNLDRGNEEDIHAYLAVIDDGELARLAAMMAPKIKEFDASALVAQAMALQAEVAAELVRRRETIARSMDYAALLKLARQLDPYSIDLLPFRPIEDYTDPTTGPVLRRLSEEFDSRPVFDEIERAFTLPNAIEHLTLADSRTKLCRPRWNSNLEEALRYAANTPKEVVSWVILEKAFKDFLNTNPIETSFNSMIAALDHFLDSSETTPPIHKAATLKKDQTSEILRTKSEVNSNFDGEEIKKHSITLGNNTSDVMRRDPTGDFDKYWNVEYPALNRSKLAWLTVAFYTFWQEHTVVYMNLQAASDKKKEAKSKNASGSTPARMNNSAIKSSKSFAAYLSEDKNRQTPNGLSASIDDFVKNKSGLSDKHAMARLREFLGTLSNVQAHQWRPGDARSTLEKCGVKCYTEATIQSCFSHLKVVFQKKN